MLFEHCSSIYQAMNAAAIDEADGEITEAATLEGKSLETVRVYDGHLTKIFAELGLATPMYTSVLRALKAMGCIEQIRRGGGAQTSKWRLVKEPDLSEWEDGEGNRPSSLKQRVTSMERELATLKHNQTVIMRHLGVQL